MCSCAIRERIAWRASRERRGEETPVGGRAWRHAVRRGGRPRVWCTCAPLQGDPQLIASARVVAHSVPFTSARSNGHDNRYSPERGYHRVFVPSGIYDSILWTPTLLVHHLLSQSSRLTRRIDMRQARDYVSTTSNIWQILKFSNTLTSVSCVSKVIL